MTNKIKKLAIWLALAATSKCLNSTRIHRWGSVADHDLFGVFLFRSSAELIFSRSPRVSAGLLYRWGDDPCFQCQQYDELHSLCFRKKSARSLFVSRCGELFHCIVLSESLVCGVPHKDIAFVSTPESIGSRAGDSTRETIVRSTDSGDTVGGSDAL